MLGRVKIALLQDLFIKVLVLCNLWQVPSASGSSTLSERGLCEAGLGQGSVSGGAHSWRSVFSLAKGRVSSWWGLRIAALVFSSMAAVRPFLCHVGRLFYLSSCNFLIHKTETKNVLVKGITGPPVSTRALKFSC